MHNECYKYKGVAITIESDGFGFISAGLLRQNGRVRARPAALPTA
jgi:hypothetical protein